MPGLNEAVSGLNADEPGLNLEGVRLLVNGSELVEVPEPVRRVFAQGDRLVALPGGRVLHIPKREADAAAAAVGAAAGAFQALGSTSERQITAFFTGFAQRLETSAVWTVIEAANAADVAQAQERGRSTTRLAVSEKMRREMVAGLRQWAEMPSPVGRVLETVQHDGWVLEQVYSPLGVVAFVFEGRPNVFADAAGVVRSGNTAVFRIGRDALATAQAIMEHALQPALKDAGLPEGAVTLVNSRDHAAGWALFSDSRVALAVARGSGEATRQLGAIARTAGIPASLHGAGGAWLVADETADRRRFEQVVIHSLDRKVCNTLNTVCIVEERAANLVPALLRVLEERGQREEVGFRLHFTPGSRRWLPAELLQREVNVYRAGGPVTESAASVLAETDLAVEWEWERTPELSLVVVPTVAQAIEQFNRFSPRFVASLISQDPAAHDRFFAAINAPFVGDGFTRWVDGQFALNRPELGLSNWQNGRLFARSGILSGDSIFTVRMRARQIDPNLHR